MSRLKTLFANESFQYEAFVRVWAVFGLLLFAYTWILWTPQIQFPQIPFFEFLIDLPGFLDWYLLAAVGLSLAGCVLAPKRFQRIGLVAFALAAGFLILLNQHRLQPWAYQFLVFAIILAAARPKTALFWLRWIAISIYIYSAISKLDYQFVHTVGDQILFGLGDKFGINTLDWQEATRHWVVLGFPIAELAIGIGLLIPKTRRFAMVLAVLMHVTLLVALYRNVEGMSVLVWNLYFIAQAFFLFGSKRESVRQDDQSTESVTPATQSSRKYPLEFAAVILAGFVLLFPATEPMGFSDHWPAWQVYAPRTSRARMNQQYRSKDLYSDPNYWSQKILTVPIYPNDRFQFAAIFAAQQKYSMVKNRPIFISGISDRWTGEREVTTLSGDQIKMHAETYRLNIKPRSFWFDDDVKNTIKGKKKDLLE